LANKYKAVDGMAFRHSIITLISVALATFSLSAAAGVRVVPSMNVAVQPEQADTGSKQLYIVQLTQPSALSVIGSYEEFNPDASHVLQHVYELKARQDELLLSINAVNDAVYRYNYTLNGMAVMITTRQADKLRKRKGVARVWRDRQRMVATNESPQFLGLLDSANGLQSANGLTGEDIVIGVIDSGIAPDHPSFSDRKAGKKAPRLCRSTWAETSLLGLFLCSKHKRKAKPTLFYDPPKNWRGTCQTGPGFATDDCNNKLIGARFYRAGFDAAGDTDAREFNSPADADGHGTHIATIAAGNKVSATVLGRDAGTIRGMAPRARVAAYKACWLEPQATRASCSTADLINAIEDAVADGVDIINYSLGDGDGSISNPDDIALLAAAEAGVFTAVAAGNSGPDLETIQSPGTNPWVITVGSSSRPGTTIAEGMRIDTPDSLAREYETIEANFTPKLSSTGPLTGNLLVVKREAGADEDGSIYDGCSEFSNAAEIFGNIALIERGGCTFQTKIRQAQSAGATAVIIYNNDFNIFTMSSADSKGITIPALMIGQADGQLILDQLAGGATVSLTLDSSIRLKIVDDGNILSRFSSRGPDVDFLKPDVIAPGKNILGGNTTKPANGKQGQEFQHLSGTSQATPHVAGVAALIKQARKDWTPAAIKSALITTSRQADIVREEDSAPATAIDMGAGQIVPNNALNPGLLYETAIAEFDVFLCANEQPRLSNAECQALFAAVDTDNKPLYGLRAEDINLPSAYIRELIAAREIKRRVTNPGPAAIYDAEWQLFDADGNPSDINVAVTPAKLDLGQGETKHFTLTFSVDANVEASKDLQVGHLKWVNSDHVVYSPLVVQPSTAQLATQLFATGTGAAGSLPLDLEFGYTGEYYAVSTGLHLPLILDRATVNDKCPDPVPTVVANGNFEAYELRSDCKLQDSVKRIYLEVPATDNRYLRLATFDEYTDGNDDLDLYLYFCDDLDNDMDCEPINDTSNKVELKPIGEGLSNSPGQSQNIGSSAEIIEVDNPPAGTYILDVHGYSTDDISGGEGAEFSAFAWSFGDLSPEDADAPLDVPDAPDDVVRGTEATITANWSGLATGLWFGGISHHDVDGVITGALTVIEIDNAFFLQD
jgi:subtilisin family serine protease